MTKIQASVLRQAKSGDFSHAAVCIGVGQFSTCKEWRDALARVLPHLPASSNATVARLIGVCDRALASASASPLANIFDGESVAVVESLDAAAAAAPVVLGSPRASAKRS